MVLLLVSPATTFILGIALGAILLIVGFALARGLGRRKPTATESLEADPHEVARLLNDLNRRTEEFKDEVAGYKSTINEVSHKLVEVHTSQQPAAPEVVALLQDVLHANDSVQRRLASAEGKLQVQGVEIEAYMTEARTDALTCIPNRRAFEDEVSRRFAQWERHGIAFSLLIVDIDHFKSFNDKHGHLVGDYVLRQVAKCLHHSMRQADFVARYGGEEFAIIFPNQEPTEAKQAADRVRVVIEEVEFVYEDQPLQVTVSGGLATAETDDTLQKLVSRADQALYSSKRAGRNVLHWHDGDGSHPINMGTPSDNVDDKVDAPATKSAVRE